MNPPEAVVERRDSALVVVLIFSLASAALALTSQSLWIDEANSALKAMQPSLASWWHVFVAEKGSDLQMPLYMFYLWGWEKFAGHSELALRLANVPWLILGNYSLYRTCRRNGLNPLPLLAVAAVNPFLWFYLNEARPYLMQYCGSCLVICGLSEMLNRRVSAAEQTPKAICFLFFGTILLAGSSLLGFAWAGSALLALAFIYLRVRPQKQFRQDLPLLALTLMLLALLAGYYLWTLSNGARASAVGKMGFRNVAYVFYELFGFSGLGPGRLELRDGTLSSFQRYLLPVLLLMALVCFSLAAAFRPLLDPVRRPKLIAGLIYGLPAAGAVILLGFIANFRVLGRHLMPLSPLICIVLTIGLVRLWKTRWKIAVAGFCLLWFCSALSLRFAARHRKDDYRGAAAVAQAALSDRKTVWWTADLAAARYYNLPLASADTLLVPVLNPTDADLNTLPKAGVVILSKPDLYDANGALATYLGAEKYWISESLQAFTVWRR